MPFGKGRKIIADPPFGGPVSPILFVNWRRGVVLEVDERPRPEIRCWSWNRFRLEALRGHRGPTSSYSEGS